MTVAALLAQVRAQAVERDADDLSKWICRLCWARWLAHEADAHADSCVLAHHPETMEDETARMAPVQRYAFHIPWAMHLRAYSVYAKRYGKQQALIEGGCRGGFYTDELDDFIPGWREELLALERRDAELKELRAEVAALKVAAESPALSRPETVEDETAVADALGLTVDMTDTDRLRAFGRNIMDYGADISHWSDAPFVARWLFSFAERLDECVRDVGKLRAAALKSSPTLSRQAVERALSDDEEVEQWAVEAWGETDVHFFSARIFRDKFIGRLVAAGLVREGE